jgi:hypothetical protein
MLASAIIDQVNAGEWNLPTSRRQSCCDFSSRTEYLAISLGGGTDSLTRSF